MLRIYNEQGDLLRYQSYLGEWKNLNNHPSGNESYMTWCEGNKVPYEEDAFTDLRISVYTTPQTHLKQE